MTTSSVHIKEIVIDGELDEPVMCGIGVGFRYNIVLWDMSDPLNPVRVPEGILAVDPSPRNDRAYVRTDIELPSGRPYRLAAKVVRYRETSAVGPLVQTGIVVRGGLSAEDVACNEALGGCSGCDPGKIFLALRYAVTN